MLKPGLWPPHKPRTTQSHAELTVYEALAKQLPQGWYAWHSLRIRVPGHPDAEADFVIVDPARGILILEVKGGRIEERDGHWYSNGLPLKHAPRQQANGFMRELIQMLHSKDISPPACGIATCFPDTEFTSGPSQGDVKNCVLGAQDLRWLDKALPILMECALTSGHRPKGKWLQAIHDLWGETWLPKMDFGLRTSLDKEERIRLDGEQFSVLQGLMENESLLVIGAAGTGKTALALGVAKKLAEGGKRVLVLCFTEPLARWLNEQIGTPNPAVWAIKRYAVELLRQAGRTVVIEETPEFWTAIVLEAVTEALPRLSLNWDAVIVDESQDLKEEDWLLIEELTKGKLLWAFWDPDQSFWPARQVREDLFKTRYRLQNRYRCPEEVRMLAGSYLGETADTAALHSASEQNVVVVRACPGTGTVLERIGYEIDRLLGSGLEPADIAVLSLRGGAQPESIVHRQKIGTHRVVRAHDPDAGSHVVAETFLRFKGLERPAIIITDISLASGKPDYRKRMYIALTRALSTARIIDTRDSLLRDPFLSPFCS